MDNHVFRVLKVPKVPEVPKVNATNAFYPLIRKMSSLIICNSNNYLNVSACLLKRLRLEGNFRHFMHSQL